MTNGKALKTAIYFSLSLLQGVCLILLPAASFIFKDPQINAINDQQYGLSFFPMNFAAIIVALNFRRLLRAFGSKNLFYLSVLCHIVFLLLVSKLNLAIGNNGVSFALILAANFFLGIGFGLLTSLLSLYIMDLYPQKRSAMVTGLHSFLGIGAASAPLLINYFYQRGFWVGAAICSLIAISLVLVFSVAAKAALDLKASQQGEGAETEAVSSLSTGAKLFILTVIFYGILEAIIGNWSALYLVREKGFSLRTASLALSLFWVFMTIGRMSATFLTLKMDPRWLYRLSPLLIFISLLFVIGIHKEGLILFAYAAAGLSCSYFFPLTLSISTQYHDQWRESLPAFVIAGLMFGVCIGSFAIGFLRERMLMNLGQAFWVASLSALIVWCFSIYLTLQKPAGVPGTR